MLSNSQTMVIKHQPIPVISWRGPEGMALSLLYQLLIDGTEARIVRGRKLADVPQISVWVLLATTLHLF